MYFVILVLALFHESRIILSVSFVVYEQDSALEYEVVFERQVAIICECITDELITYAFLVLPAGCLSYILYLKKEKE